MVGIWVGHHFSPSLLCPSAFEALSHDTIEQVDYVCVCVCAHLEAPSDEQVLSGVQRANLHRHRRAFQLHTALRGSQDMVVGK